MRIKHLLLTAGLLTMASSASLSAAPVEYKIPATQDEFEAQWKQLSGESAWTLDATGTPFVSLATTKGEQSSILVYSTPIEMKAGDVYEIQASIGSPSWSDDENVSIMAGTGEDDMSMVGTQQKVYSTPSYKPSTPAVFTAPADGSYYLGIRSDGYAGNSGTQGTLKFLGIKYEKSVNYPQSVSSIKSTVGEDGALEVTLSWTYPTKLKDGSDATGELKANIYRSTSSSKSELFTPENLIATVTGGVPGKTGSFTDKAGNTDKPIEVGGKYNYYIAAANDLGENSEFASGARIETKWVGEDDECYNIVATTISLKAIGDNSIEITFTPRKDSRNDGWIDPEKVFLKVVRVNDKNEESTITEEAPMVSPFVDNSITEKGTYKYKLYVRYKGKDSSAAETAAIFAGGAFDVPYSQTFDASADFNLFTVFGNNNSYKWAYSNSDNAAMFSGGYSEYNSTMVVPPLKLEAGVPYVISCDAWVSTVVDDSGDDGDDSDPWGDYYSAATPKATTATHNNVLRFLLGQEATATGLKEIDVVEINKTSANKVSCKVFFSVETSGNYYIGFKALTEGYSDKKYVDNIKVEVSKTIPAAVADFKADTNLGANEAKISFTLPAKTNTGTALSSLTKAVVTRYDAENVAAVVKTIEGDDATPGAAVAFTDALPASGKYSYSVVCYLGEDASDAATTEAVWYGYDIPKSVSSFGISVNTDGASPVVTWTALSGTAKGMNGGYVDDANLKYRVYRRQYMADKAADDSYTLVEEVSECSFTDSETADLEWSKYYYSISVVNGDKEGARAESSRSAVLGDAVMMPYQHDFTNEKSFEIFEGRGWYSEKDNANECYIYSANDRGETAGKENTIYFPPFRSNNGINLGCRVNFGLSRTNADTEENVEIYLCTLESDKPSIESGAESNPEAATIAGEDNREIVTTLPVTAAANDPQIENVKFNLPATGRYRIALRLASPDSKGVNLHSFSMENNLTSTGIDGIGVDAIDSEAVYYNLQGIRIDNPANGIYIRRTAGKSEKVVIR